MGICNCFHGKFTEWLWNRTPQNWRRDGLKRLFPLITRLAQKLEHIPLVKLHAGLVKGVNPQQIGGDAAGQLEEIEEVAQLHIVQLTHVHGDDRHAAVRVGGYGAAEGLLVYEIQGLAFQIVETVQILPVGAHEMCIRDSLCAGADEENASLLGIEQAVGAGVSGLKGDQRAEMCIRDRLKDTVSFALGPPRWYSGVTSA